MANHHQHAAVIALEIAVTAVRSAMGEIARDKTLSYDQVNDLFDHLDVSKIDNVAQSLRSGVLGEGREEE